VQLLAKISEERKGVIFVVFGHILWAFFSILLKIVYEYLPPIQTAAWSMTFATLFFGLVLLVSGRFHELFNSKIWKDLLGVALVIGIGYYGFNFYGTNLTTAGSAALVGRMEVWMTFIFFSLIIRTERYTRSALVGAALMFAGGVLAIFQGNFQPNLGDLFVFIGTMFPPLGNFLTQRIRSAKISAATIMFVRNLIAAPFLFLLSYFLGEEFSLSSAYEVWPWLMFAGFFLFGVSKICWVEAIHRIPVAQGLSIAMFLPVMAFFWAYLFLGEIPSWTQLVSLPFLIAGGYLVLGQKFLRD